MNTVRNSLFGLAQCPHVTRSLITAVLVTLLPTANSQAETIQWIRQWGTSAQEDGRAVSVDRRGSVYIAGYMGDFDFFGHPFIRKYDEYGDLQWEHQLEYASSRDDRYVVSADGLGNVFVVGGSVVSKFDASGTLQWSLQDNSFIGAATSTDGLGSVYVSGTSRFFGTDATVTKYDARGTLQWTRNLGTNYDDESFAVSADGRGNVYISGYTRGNLGRPNIFSEDAFVSKYDAAGNLQWTRQLGTDQRDVGFGVSADRLGNVFIVGETRGNLDGTSRRDWDAFVSKYDADGNLQWIRQLDTGQIDEAWAVSSDGLGNVYVSGNTFGNLAGLNAGSRDAFVIKYDGMGSLLWSHQVGSNGFESGSGISSDGQGNVYLTGLTWGSLGGPNFGREDAYVVKISEVPEPGGWPLLLLACLSPVFGHRAKTS